MDVESRAIRALSFLHDAGAFAACVPGAKPCAVVDIGAGQESPRKVIKRMGLNVKYLPVDYKARSEETIVCNLNNIEFPHAQLENYNVVAFLALGSLEYVIHRWALVASLAMYPNAVTIIHYQFGKGRSAKDFAWVSPLLPEHFSVLVAPFNGAFYPDALAELHVSKNLPSYGAITCAEDNAAECMAQLVATGLV
ncbi:hypothetical protein Rsub_06889 [Raphidocelis subcapitata]|uniref:Methyltransferase type 11 domain-containing protein n=1 Tax=Raphidocelis subcapitata TaxID=307507 RepID=A0A2V0P7Q9_9CHLO|nr:hypothetical protein Rsub_06889 [Raphidocelis subcapitata]|eukprot:GBF93890.1 hypothetical protein Rsub_06889 [Raphidocelis subcapitata]